MLSWKLPVEAYSKPIHHLPIVFFEIPYQIQWVSCPYSTQVGGPARKGTKFPSRLKERPYTCGA